MGRGKPPKKSFFSLRVRKIEEKALWELLKFATSNSCERHAHVSCMRLSFFFSCDSKLQNGDPHFTILSPPSSYSSMCTVAFNDILNLCSFFWKLSFCHRAKKSFFVKKQNFLRTSRVQVDETENFNFPKNSSANMLNSAF